MDNNFKKDQGKVAILNDIHFGVRGNSEIFLEYQKRFYSEVFFPFLKENGISNVWVLGDFYDNRKNISIKTQHETRKMFLEPLVENGIHMTMIPGNHDTAFKNSNKVSSLKELLGYFTENISIIMEPMEIVYSNKMKSLWLPWINSENEESSMKAIKQTDANVLLGHLELSGFPMYKGDAPFRTGMNPSLFEKFDMVLTGHFHTKSSRKNIHYLGSQMEFTWSDCDDPKFFHVLNLNTLELAPIRNPITIYKKIRYNDQGGILLSPSSIRKLDTGGKFVRVIIEQKNDPHEFDRFIEKIENSNPLDINISDSTVYGDFMDSSGGKILLKEDDVQKASEDLVSFMSEYIDGIDDTSLDRNKLKQMASSIYREAELLETK